MVFVYEAEGRRLSHTLLADQLDEVVRVGSVYPRCGHFLEHGPELLHLVPGLQVVLHEHRVPAAPLAVVGVAAAEHAGAALFRAGRRRVGRAVLADIPALTVKRASGAWCGIWSSCLFLLSEVWLPVGPAAVASRSRYCKSSLRQCCSACSGASRGCSHP